ncbi:MAG: MGMT family protein [Nanoarchaeota archaeon]|nr:MGMT family protein [Nanoarchaeota archaeon]MBU1005027.1 MGMT family protein [Nanoarchaeota archaeon]MBU1946753.1 MGMT family protein [Nanoarchaeota archaeon]
MLNFNKKVYNLTKKVPKGKVTTYKIIANKLKTAAYRAVGTALKNNKKLVIIPCHRVINSKGSIGSYKGIKNSKEKAKLLRKEGIKINNDKINLKKYLFKL